VTTAAVVLAAGGGTRFRGSTHKLLADLDGRPVVAHVLDAVAEAALDGAYVVVGAVEVPVPPAFTVVTNERWAEGMATSLRAGVLVAAADGHDAVVVGLGDQPGVTTEAWRRMAAAAAPVAVATYDGVRGHPVRLAAETWDALPTSGDVGARALLAGRDFEVAEVPCPGSPVDVDTVEDLQSWS
jgi:molybdenum cofactor cytidylyltransferase